MIVERSMHAEYLSNAYLIADEPGGSAVFIDTGAPIDPLMRRAGELDVSVTHVLNTHDHHDHTAYNIELLERFDAQLLTADDFEDGEVLCVGALAITAMSTPGHTGQHMAFEVNGHACFTGDALFRETVGGTLGGGPHGFRHLRRSIMDVLLQLPPDTVLYPGHTDETSVHHEWENNPFVRVWRGLEHEGSEPVTVAGTEAQLVLWAGDYDGGNKAWVRFGDGADAIVGGSRVERTGTPA